MKKISILSLILVAVFGLNLAVKAAEPTNLLNQHYFGFESAVEKNNMDKGWFFPAPLMYSLTSEKAATGTYSLKFHTNDVTTAAEFSQGFCGSGEKNPADSKVTLPAGTYTASVKVWVGDDAPSAFEISINTPWKTMYWKLKNVEKNKWVTLTQDISFEETTGSKMTIKVQTKNMPSSGSCTLFIDDISIVAKN